jgi:hypothetical protein
MKKHAKRMALKHAAGGTAPKTPTGKKKHHAKRRKRMMRRQQQQITQPTAPAAETSEAPAGMKWIQVGDHQVLVRK